MLNFVKPFLLLSLMILPGFALAEGHSHPLVSVTGEGRISATPDIGLVTLGVRRQAATAAGALQAANRAASEILATIESAGIEPRDVQTVRVGLNPVWQHRQNAQPQVTGYEAINDLAIRVRDLDGMGVLIDDLVRDGANSIQNIAFSIDDPSALQSEARRAAVLDARDKAETMADAAGVELGALEHLSEMGAAVPQPRVTMMERGLAMDEAMASAVPMATGEMEIVVRVSAAWRLAEE
jgi:uncharacterized protein YggE